MTVENIFFLVIRGRRRQGRENAIDVGEHSKTHERSYDSFPHYSDRFIQQYFVAVFCANRMVELRRAPCGSTLLIFISVVSCLVILPISGSPTGSWSAARLGVGNDNLHSLYDALGSRLHPFLSDSIAKTFQGLNLFGSINVRVAGERIEWKQRSISTDGLTLAFYRTEYVRQVHRRAGPNSQEKPKLVFLHGLVGSASSLIPYLIDLANEYQIFMPDARGHGDTQPIPHHSFLLKNLVADAAAAIIHFSPEGPVYLVGHSMGASTAAHIARRFPELVSAVVLEDPPWLRMQGSPVLPVDHYWTPFEFARSLKNMSDRDFERMNSRSIKYANLLPPATSGLEAWRKFDADEIEPTFITADDAINEAVEGIRVPVLVQTGGNESVCVQKVLKATMTTWTHGREKNFVGAPHSIHLEPYKQAWIRSIRYFLLEHRRSQ